MNESNLAGMLLNNPAVVGQIAQSLGLGESQARSGMEALLPGLARGLGRNAERPGGLDALLGALKSGNHGRYLDEPQSLGQRSAQLDGAAILGHVFGSKDVSRNMAGSAARQSGVDSTMLKQMLPMLAAAAMAVLNKQTQGGSSTSGLGPQRGAGSSAGLDMLETFLDSNRDGSVIDDVLNLATKFF